MNYFSFQLHITDECDQRCKHCYIFSEDTAKPLVTMDFQHLEAVVDNACDMCEKFNRIPYFYITGGDPILHPDFWKLLELLHSRDIEFTLMGNPFHLTEENLGRMKKLGCEKYQMSLDGMRETHDWFRKPGSFDETLSKIPLINKAGIRSVIMTTVSGTNIKEVPDIIDAVVAHGVNVFAFGRYCPTSSEKDVAIAPLEYRALLDVCHKKFTAYEKAGCETYFNHKDHLWTLYEWEEGIFKIPENAETGTIYGGCNCGNCHITILPNGDVYACRRFESRVGNVFSDLLSDIWTGEKMESFREFTRFKKCSKCKLLAWCRGCPAVTYGVTGDFYEADPQCWYEKMSS